MKGKIFVISAPSGSGKSTIVRNLLKENSQLTFSVSATTRKKRLDEIDGKHYYFISEKEFKEKIDSQDFIEWECFYDYYYGTLKTDVEQNINNGKSVVLEVDVKGALKIKNVYPNAVLIFIVPPSIDELNNRLVNRNTETKEDLAKRVERAEMELSFKDQFDYLVVNDNLQNAIDSVKNILNKEIRG